MRESDLDERLAAAAPELPAVQDLIDDLARDITRSEPVRLDRIRTTRRRKAVTVGLAVSGVLALAAAGYAVAARTGVFGSLGMSENDTSEWLDMSAADFGRVAGELVPRDVQLPGWTDWSAARSELVASGQRQPGWIQETGVRAHFEFYAQCAWLAEWSAERAAGDRGGAARAERTYTTLIDRSVAVATDGGGVRESMRRVAAAMREGRTAEVTRELDLNCPRGIAERAAESR